MRTQEPENKFTRSISTLQTPFEHVVRLLLDKDAIFISQIVELWGCFCLRVFFFFGGASYLWFANTIRILWVPKFVEKFNEGYCCHCDPLPYSNMMRWRIWRSLGLFKAFGKATLHLWNGIASVIFKHNLSGQNLKVIIPRRGVLPIWEAVRVVQQAKPRSIEETSMTFVDRFVLTRKSVESWFCWMLILVRPWNLDFVIIGSYTLFLDPFLCTNKIQLVKCTIICTIFLYMYISTLYFDY